MTLIENILAQQLATQQRKELQCPKCGNDETFYGTATNWCVCEACGYKQDGEGDKTQ